MAYGLLRIATILQGIARRALDAIVTDVDAAEDGCLVHPLAAWGSGGGA